jgi:hypothetical protein
VIRRRGAPAFCRDDVITLRNFVFATVLTVTGTAVADSAAQDAVPPPTAVKIAVKAKGIH